MAPPPSPLSPQDRVKWFVHDRFGMFIHWGLYSIPARGEWIRSHERIPEETYTQYFEEFNPVRYDPRKWARLAKEAGMRYVVLTAKHHDGFCLFDSKLTDWKSTNAPCCKRDLVAEYVEAIRAEGLKVGLYYSLLDWHHPDYPAADKHHPMRDNEEFRSRERNFSRYQDYMHGQVKELVTGYGPLDVLWFDFSYDNMSGPAWRADELMKMVRTHQPNVLVDNRLHSGHENISTGGGSGDFSSPEQIIPAEGVKDRAGNPVTWEACITLNDHWGYARDDKRLKSAAQVIRMLVGCVSKGGNLLLNIGPNPLGEIPVDSVAVLEDVGNWVGYNQRSIVGCGGAGLPRPEWGYFTRNLANPNLLYAHVLNKPVGRIQVMDMGWKVKKARMLADGSEVRIIRPWHAMGADQHLFLDLPNGELPDPLDTVIELELK